MVPLQKFQEEESLSTQHCLGVSSWLLKVPQRRNSLLWSTSPGLWPFHTHTVKPLLKNELTAVKLPGHYIHIYSIPIYEDMVRNVTAKETSSFSPYRSFTGVQPKMLWWAVNQKERRGFQSWRECVVGQPKVSVSRLSIYHWVWTSQFHQVAVPLESARKDTDSGGLFLLPHNWLIFWLLKFSLNI